MRTISSFRRRAAMLVGATAIATLVGGLAGAGVAAADVPVNETDTWSGVFPLSGSKPVDITIATNLPSPVTVNTESGSFTVTLSINAGSSLRSSLNLLGAKTIEGTAAASVTITDSASNTVQQFIDFTIPKQNVPTSGNLVINATGSTTAPAIATAGPATVEVDPFASTHLHPKNSSGGNTLIGEFDVDLELNAGEDPALGTITVS